MLRVVFTGGGSGGHIYPLIAVAEEFAKMQEISVQISYLGPKNPLNSEFTDRDIRVHHIASSKIRRYFSLQNFIDVPKFIWSIVQALYRLYVLMPDVVFSKGGPGSLAVVLAARFYFIPVLIHESDAVPGLANRIAGKLAQRVAISFPEAEKFFPKKKVALTGNPIRSSLLEMILDRPEAKRKMNFDPNVPLILVLGGSQGAEQINDFIIDNLPSLLTFSQVLHQTGIRNFEHVESNARAIISQSTPSLASRYRVVALLENTHYSDALSAADVVLSRSGSVIAEIAAFGKPSILVPLENAANDHQRANAYSYAASGAAEVFEGVNFTYHIVSLKLKEIIEHPEVYERMHVAAQGFARTHAAQIIAEELVRLSMIRR